jgi:hypothetical protein
LLIQIREAAKNGVKSLIVTSGEEETNLNVYAVTSLSHCLILPLNEEYLCLEPQADFYLILIVRTRL